jgi:hypothetical protein
VIAVAVVVDRLASAQLHHEVGAATFARTRGASHADTRACAQALIDLYSAWDKAEPGKGHDAEAAEWRANLEVTK